MISALFHGPGKNKGASYFHPDHGLIDYIATTVKGPQHLHKDIELVKAPTSAVPETEFGALALRQESKLTVMRPGVNYAGAELVKMNPKSIHQWHADDLLRCDMTRDPEYIRTMRFFHGDVWRHRPEFRNPRIQTAARWWCFATVPMLCYITYAIGTMPRARG
mmetsp:Transcript_8080/g.14377  ORF Transcript_8080/g.14377 Transcript_8080/m.14377 type:complete len:163 (-) Transcript_8080:189-677(-)